MAGHGNLGNIAIARIRRKSNTVGMAWPRCHYTRKGIQIDLHSAHCNVAIPNVEIDEWPRTENSASSAVLKSAEEAMPPVVGPLGVALTPQREFKSVSPPRFTSAVVPNVEISEWPGTESSMKSALPESPERPLPSL